MIKVEVKTIKDNAKKLYEVQKAMSLLKKKEVCVGVPQESSGRKGGINNAELAYIHTHGVRSKGMRDEMQPSLSKGMKYSEAHSAYIREHGSPCMGIPARPIIEPAVEKHKDDLALSLRKAHEAAAEGKMEAVEPALARAGMLGQNAVHAQFTDNEWPPNQPETVRRKGSDSPLIDTGSLRSSMTYVVRDKKR